MQGLQSLFSRLQPARVEPAPAKQPEPLDTAKLEQVAGGLPRVGDWSAQVPPDGALPSTD